jgi:2-amino-4-hydroxy-6-hydroxymethyldihydropteridine diphosphokinase
MRMFVSLGSNIEPRQNLTRALVELRRRFRVTAVSPVYRTFPVGDTNQADFWNLVAEIENDEPPQKVQGALRFIEEILGRHRDFQRPFGPRSVDLDLVLVEGLSGSFGAVELPSPLVAKESFVAVPLADLAPTLAHPVLKIPLGELARTVLAKDPHPPRPLAVELTE